MEAEESYVTIMGLGKPFIKLISHINITAIAAERDLELFKLHINNNTPLPVR